MSDLEKQPISPISGTTEDLNGNMSAKDITDKQIADVEGAKKTAETDCHSGVEERERKTMVDAENKAKESNNDENIVNGVKENGLFPGDLRDGHVDDAKLGETCKGQADGEQVGCEGEDLENTKGKESATENNESEPNSESKDIGVAPELVTMETKGEQGESGAEESPGEAVDVGKNSQQDESLTEDKEAKHIAAADCFETNATEQFEALGDSKQSGETGEPVTMVTDGEKLEPYCKSMESELISSEMTLKQEKGSEGTKVTETGM